MTEPDRRAQRAAKRRLRKRHAAERRFRAYGAIAVTTGILALVLLLGSTVATAIPGFTHHVVELPFHFDEMRIDPSGNRDPGEIGRADYARVVKEALRSVFPDVRGRRDQRALRSLVSSGAAFDLRDRVLADPSLLGTTTVLAVPLADDADLMLKGAIDRTVPESDRRVSDQQIAWIDRWVAEGRIDRVFWTRFFTSGDSREPELAGIRGALVGTFWTLLVTLALSFPAGVAAAVYLEEFAPRGRFTSFVEVNINNLAAVPSIVFGLLGLAVFLGFFGMPRSSPLVGGLVLALMTLPTVIIASRSAIRAVPPSIREAAMGIGSSPLQVVMHHVLPLAMPGILTGTIIGMARALGETAPLLLIGMVAFIVDVPGGPTDAATALPVQIFLWADSPERAWVYKTSAAILVLLVFLVAMNLTAVLLRNRFERRW